MNVKRCNRETCWEYCTECTGNRLIIEYTDNERAQIIALLEQGYTRTDAEDLIRNMRGARLSALLAPQ